MPDEVAFRAIISGHVTGVGFRSCALDKASEFPSLKGYVMNLEHGRIEAFVQGAPEDVEKMIAWLGRGPDWARVDKFELFKAPLDHAAGLFAIKRLWR